MDRFVINRHYNGTKLPIEEFLVWEDGYHALKQYQAELNYARQLTETFWGHNHDVLTYHQTEVIENQIQEALPPMRDKDFVFLWDLSGPEILYTLDEKSLT